PKVGVLDRLLVGGAPIAPLPVGQPLRHALLHILGIRVHHHVARPLERLQRLDDGQQFHAIVGGVGLAAEKRLLVATLAQQRAPAAPAGVSLAGAVGPDFNRITAHDCFDSLWPGARMAPEWRPATTAARRTRCFLSFRAGPMICMPATRLTADTT